MGILFGDLPEKIYFDVHKHQVTYYIFFEVLKMHNKILHCSKLIKAIICTNHVNIFVALNISLQNFQDFKIIGIMYCVYIYTKRQITTQEANLAVRHSFVRK